MTAETSNIADLKGSLALVETRSMAFNPFWEHGKHIPTRRSWAEHGGSMVAATTLLRQIVDDGDEAIKVVARGEYALPRFRTEENGFGSSNVLKPDGTFAYSADIVDVADREVFHLTMRHMLPIVQLREGNSGSADNFFITLPDLAHGVNARLLDFKAAQGVQAEAA